MPDLIPFQFHSQILGVITDDNGEHWWIAAEVCAALDDPSSIAHRMPQARFMLYDMIAIASDMSSWKHGIALLKELSKLAAAVGKDTTTFWQLYGCAITNLHWNSTRLKEIDNEFYWHKIFRKHLSALIPNGKIIERFIKPKGVGNPDFIVSIPTGVCPVEIKRHTFTKAACRQLHAYIVGYKASHGYAVAQICNITLPRNMIFLSLQGLD